MSAAIQLVNQPSVNPGVITGNLATNNLATGNQVASNLVEGNFNNVSRFESAPEQRLGRAIEHIAELQAEVRTLRDEIARSERVSANYELLLRNAQVREQELRAQLVSGRY
ncbi:MAG: hypothetical protein HYR56_11025 [Acidobacteria bacterium]|nr:hypothetical protein [Acidobacteriota bacterium]MBI3428417.1 hypothetical protein [Acidobacteriota bacterium]